MTTVGEGEPSLSLEMKLFVKLLGSCGLLCILHDLLATFRSIPILQLSLDTETRRIFYLEEERESIFWRAKIPFNFNLIYFSMK